MRRVLCTRRNKEVAGGSAFTRPCGAWPCGFFQLCGLSVVCGLCRASIVAGLALMQVVRFAAAVTRSLLPVCRDFPVVRPLRFRGLTLQLPPAVCVRLRLPLRPVHPRLIARLLWRHGTARCRRTCDYGGFGNVCCCTCCIRWNPGTNTTVEASPDAGLT